MQEAVLTHENTVNNAARPTVAAVCLAHEVKQFIKQSFGKF